MNSVRYAHVLGSPLRLAVYLSRSNLGVGLAGAGGDAMIMNSTLLFFDSATVGSLDLWEYLRSVGHIGNFGTRVVSSG